MAMIALAAAGALVVGAMLTTSRTQSPDADSPRPEVGDGRVQGAINGAPISILYGEQAIAGNMIWQGDLIEHIHTSTQSVGGGKGGSGGGSSVTRTWYTYSGSFAIGLCQGPLLTGALKKIYANDQLLVDTSASPTGLESGKIIFYYGTETQIPSSVIELNEGAGNVPAFRGIAYLVFDDMDLEPYGNQYPQLHVEIEGL